MESGKASLGLSRFLSALRVPAITFGLLLVPISIYYLHVQDQREFLLSRSFRTLATMSDQITATVDNWKTQVVSNCDETKFKFLKGSCADIENNRETLHLSERSEGADVDVWLHLENSAKDRDEPATVDILLVRLKDVVQKFLPMEEEALFEDIVVTDLKEGHVLYQSSRSGLRFTDVGEFASAGSSAEPASTPAPKTTAPAGEPEGHILSRLIPTEIAGTKYTIFVQPIQLSLLRTSAKIPEEDDYAEWQLFGFVRSDRLFAESLLISYSVIEFLAMILLLVFLSWPFLKLRFMTSRERLRMGDAVFMAFSLVTGAAVTSTFVLNSYFSGEMERDSDDQLVEIGKRIQRDLRDELGLMGTQLQDFSAAVGLPAPPADAQGDSSKQESRIKGPVPGATYPNYRSASWLDEEGKQVVRWTSGKTRTSLLDVGERSYFKDFLDKGKPKWHLPDASTEFLFYSVLSSNSGTNQTVFITERKPGEKPADGLQYATIANRPLSLFNLVLPPGFGYSLVNKNGWAEFHSREERNQRENLFMESDNDAPVRAAANSTAQGGNPILTNASYLGREHSLYFMSTGITNMPLSLVTFRDRLVTRTVSLQIATVTLALVSVYLLGLALGLWIASLMLPQKVFRGQPTRLRDRLLACVWPSPEHAGSYDALTAVCAVAIVLFALCIVLGYWLPGALLVGPVLLGPATVVATVRVFRGGRLKQLGIEPWARLRKLGLPAALLRTRFTLAAVGLILALGIMPAILFWQAARHFESALFATWGKQKLEAAYQERKLNFGLPDSELKKVGFHQNGFFPAEPAESGAVAAAASNPASPSNCILSKLAAPYNQTALEIGALKGECREAVLTGGQFPGLHWPRAGSGLLALGLTLGALVVLVWGLWRIVWYAASRIFLLDKAKQFEPAAEPIIPSADTPYVLALGPVNCGKTKWIKDHKIEQPFTLFEMKDFDEAVASTSAVPAGTPIVIDHFEHGLHDKELTEQKLKILEQLVFKEKRPVLIVSGVDPLYVLTSDGGPDPGQVARWAAVMRPFQKRNFFPGNGTYHTDNDYLAEWTRCTAHEKLLLTQLAQGALANPKAGDTLRQLLWKGLIDPSTFQIKDEKFKSSILSKHQREDVKKWETQGGTGWGAMQFGFLTLVLGVGFILLAAQRDILQSWIPYVTGVAAFLANMFRTLNDFRGRENR